jgi:hypothetical protein
VTLLIHPKFGVNQSNGLGDPSIGSLRLFLVFLGCADSHLVDRPRGAWQPSCSSCSCGFLSASLSIHFVGGFLVHEVCERSVLEYRTVRDEADGPRVHHGRSVFLGVVLEVQVAISDGPCPPRGQSAPSSRTVRPDTADGSCGAFQIA